MFEDRYLNLDSVLDDLGFSKDRVSGGDFNSELKGCIEKTNGGFEFESHTGNKKIVFGDGDVFLKSLSKTEDVMKIKLW